MRRLKTIVLEGFKTFREPFVLDLEPGLTAIVGPNGCGKTNIVDAVAWASGSRSWKSLRGSEMTDVVFHGSRDREGRDLLPPSERARVALLFENSDRLLGLDVPEVEVAREIVRGGESQAYLNRTLVRLKDVQHTLAGTGLAGGFSIVRQGTVDQLVLSSGEELGRWMEEAADLARYRAQRRELLRELGTAEAKLGPLEARLEDLKKDLKRVRTQAKKARDHEALSERLRAIQSKIASAERGRLEEEIERADREIARLREEEEALAREEEALRGRRTELEDALALGASAEVPNPQGPGDATPEEMAKKGAAIRKVASELEAAGHHLERYGSAAWVAVRSRVASARTELGRILERGGISSAVPPSEGVSELPKISRALDQVEDRRRALAEDRGRREREKALSKERLGRLPGPAGGETLLAFSEHELEVAREESARLDRELAKLGSQIDFTASEREAAFEADVRRQETGIRDLSLIRKELEGFLGRVDRAASVVFRDTIRRVEERFRTTLRGVFRGGKAWVRLRPPEEGGPAEEDLPDLRDESKVPEVEIRIQIPGKAECDLRLLSGGERSLAGIALVLALATAHSGGEGKGGHLLILDEVDQALDDANVGRLSTLLVELSKTHQILTVTHHDRTKTAADTVLHVTSQVPGTSAVFTSRRLAPAAREVTIPGPAKVAAGEAP